MAVLALAGWALASAGPAAALVEDPGSEVRGQEEDAGDPVVVSVRVVGLDRVDPPLERPSRLPLHPGRPWTEEREAATEETVAQLLAERGHPYALVDVTREETPDGVRVVVEVLDAGPRVRFGPVQVEAIPPLTEAMVRERLAYDEGDGFRPSLLRATQERLLGEPVVERAVVLPVGLLQGDTTAATVVSVAPVDRPRSPELHGVISSQRCLELSGFWRDRFFLGGPRVLSVGGGVGNVFAQELGNRFPCSEAGEGEHAGLDYSAEGELRIPWPGDPLTVVRGRAFFHRRSAPPVYVERGFGASLEAQRELTPTLRVLLGYRLQRMDLRAAGVFLCANFGACTGPETEALAGPSRWAPLEGRIQWLPRETRRARGPSPDREPRPEPGAGEEGRESLAPGPNPLVPEWRPWAEGSVGVAGTLTGSRSTYGRLDLRGGVGRTVGRRGEVAVRGRVGALLRGEDALLPQVFLLSGGAGSVRGVQANLLGPRILEVEAGDLETLGCRPEPQGCPPGIHAPPDLVAPRPQGGTLVAEAGVEARVRLVQWLEVAGFVDAGVLRAPSMALEAAEGRSGVRWAATPGVGARVDTPVGLIRLDVALDPRSPRRAPVLARWDEERAPGTAHEPGDLVPMGEAIFDPFTYDSPGTLRELARRLHVTVGVGQPF